MIQRPSRVEEEEEEEAEDADDERVAKELSEQEEASFAAAAVAPVASAGVVAVVTPRPTTVSIEDPRWFSGEPQGTCESSERWILRIGLELAEIAVERET